MSLINGHGGGLIPNKTIHFHNAIYPFDVSGITSDSIYLHTAFCKYCCLFFPSTVMKPGCVSWENKARQIESTNQYFNIYLKYFYISTSINRKLYLVFLQTLNRLSWENKERNEFHCKQNVNHGIWTHWVYFTYYKTTHWYKQHP